LFSLISALHVDLLKKDVEGSEFELLADPRFAQFDIDIIVLEWHVTADRSDAKARC